MLINTVRHEKSLTGLKRLKTKKVKIPLSGDKNVTWLTLISTSCDTRKSICIWVPTEQWHTSKRTRRPTFYWQSRFTNNTTCWLNGHTSADPLSTTTKASSTLQTIHFRCVGRWASIIRSPLTSNNLNIGLLHSNNVYNS